MAVNKRVRFEVLRRDGFRCFYCGTRGNETTGSGLTIDHVVPVALGGGDHPENLVSSCGDCNAGKTSTVADAPLVAMVDRAAAAHRAGRELAIRALVADLGAQSDYEADIWALWEGIAPSYMVNRTPKEWPGVVASWFRQGVPHLVVENAFQISWGNRSVTSDAKFVYAAGIVRRLMDGAEDRAVSLAAGNDVIFKKGYDSGVHDAEILHDYTTETRDLVAAHIDGRHDDGMYGVFRDGRFLPWKRQPRGA